MTTYLKLMSDEDLPDVNAWKGYRIVTLRDGAEVAFDKASQDYAQSRFSVTVTNNGEGFNGEIPLVGNAYLMSENGKTIASHGC